jgi:hypothetical protein
MRRKIIQKLRAASHQKTHRQFDQCDDAATRQTPQLNINGRSAHLLEKPQSIPMLSKSNMRQTLTRRLKNDAMQQTKRAQTCIKYSLLMR